MHNIKGDIPPQQVRAVATFWPATYSVLPNGSHVFFTPVPLAKPNSECVGYIQRAISKT